MKKVLLGVVVIFILCSCVSVQTNKMPSSDLQETVITYWQLRKAGDLQTAWNFERRSLIPEPDRRAIFRSAYMSKEPNFIVRNFEILEFGKEGSHHKGFTPVKIKVDTFYPPTLAFDLPTLERTVILEDLWDKVDNKWYRVHVTAIGEFY